MPADWLNRLDPREKAGLILVVVAVTVMLLDRFVAMPLVARCAELDRDITEEVGTRALHEGWLRARSQVEREFEGVRARLGEPVAPAAAIVAMKNELDQLARDSEVTVIAIKHREPRHAEVYDEYAVDGEFETDEIGLMRFLHVLAATPGTYRVTRLKITPDSTSQRIKGSMTITKMMLPEAPAGGA